MGIRTIAKKLFGSDFKVAVWMVSVSTILALILPLFGISHDVAKLIQFAGIMGSFVFYVLPKLIK